jgi:hypothetical protein
VIGGADQAQRASLIKRGRSARFSLNRVMPTVGDWES